MIAILPRDARRVPEDNATCPTSLVPVRMKTRRGKSEGLAMARRLLGRKTEGPEVGEPHETIAWLGNRLSERRCRLFACACCRTALQYQTEERWYDVLEALEAKVETRRLRPRLDPPRPSRRVARSNTAGIWALEALW